MWSCSKTKICLLLEEITDKNFDGIKKVSVNIPKLPLCCKLLNKFVLPLFYLYSLELHKKEGVLTTQLCSNSSSVYFTKHYYDNRPKSLSLQQQ